MYKNILSAFYDAPWAITPTKLEAISQFLERKARGETIDFKAEASKPRPGKQGAIAIIPIQGVITQKANMMSEISGGVSTEMLKSQILAAVNDSSVKAIVLDVDSPGGSTYGLIDLSETIFAARQKKHITAVANSQAASAAYWIASASSEIVVAPGGDVGSIGVYTAHRDVSKAEESDGVKTTLISAGKMKVAGNSHEPLTDDIKAHIQARVDEAYDDFTKYVAKYRGVSLAAVRGGYGEGAVLSAKAALKEGMVDKIMTLDDVLVSLGGDPTNLRAAKVKMI